MQRLQYIAELDIALASKSQKLRLYSPRAIIPDLVDWFEDMMISDDVHPSASLVADACSVV